MGHFCTCCKHMWTHEGCMFENDAYSSGMQRAVCPMCDTTSSGAFPKDSPAWHYLDMEEFEQYVFDVRRGAIKAE